MTWVVACIFIYQAVTVLSQRPFSGPCPKHAAQEGFDMGSFLGTWYEIEKTSLVQDGVRCIKTKYIKTNDGKLTLTTTGINLLGIEQSSRGEAVLESLDPATLLVQYNTIIGLPVSTTLKILDTDYKNYAVVWSCSPVLGPLGHTENLWLLSRKTSMDPDVRKTLMERLTTLNIDHEGLRTISHQNCT
ncbi:apolipoprotein D-like [Centruroides vittatus]|uniref:apolipoprotein D-like n=1 Tax=Centruroides vittatus TaxID=120091 RepID=UPI00350F8B13